MKKLLAIFAHPDDEGAISGTLAHYAGNNTEVMLICTTRGEAGEISDPTLATPETLAEVRTEELRAACDIIGIRELHFLGYRDSGMANTPANEDPRALVQAKPEEAIGRLVALIRRLKPDIVITFEPFGWYGHPDHQTTERFVTAAYEHSGEAAAYPEAGPPWQPQRLFYTAMPFSRFQAMVDYAKAHDIDISMFEQLPQDLLQQTEAQITHIMDIRHLFETKQAAMQVHRTQFGEDNLFRKVPEEVSRQMMGYEHFIQVYPPPAAELRQNRAKDLFYDQSE